MSSLAKPPIDMKPVLIVGAGPVGLTTALGLSFYGLPFHLFEEDAGLSSDTKAGTILTRTLEAFRRYGVADQVLAKALRVGERVPDMVLHNGFGRPVRLHDLVDDSFVALYFTDVWRRPAIPADTLGLKHRIVSRRDAPTDSGLRERSLFDVGDRFRQRAGCAPDTVMLVRPDDHIAAIAPMRDGLVEELYRKITRSPGPVSKEKADA